MNTLIKKYKAIKLFLFLSSILFVILVIVFHDLEPGIDQIRHISWAKSLNDSHYLINLSLVNQKGLFFFDQNSFIHNLLKTAYSDIGHLFNIVPILILYSLNFIFDNPVLIFNITSIGFSTLNIIICYLLLNEINQREINKDVYNWIILLYFLSLVPVYLILYSPLGIHNISVFFLLCCIYILISKNKKNNFFFIVFLSLLGIFSHKINTLIIPILISLFYFFEKDYKNLIKYIISIGVIFLPIILIIIFYPEVINSTRKFSQLSNEISLFQKFILWFQNIFYTVGYITFSFFCYGLIIYSKKKYSIFIFLIFIHLFLYLLIDSFSNYYLRTNLYIVHTILIFSFYGFLETLKIKKLISLISFFVFSGNIIFNFYSIIEKETLYKNLHQKFQLYYVNNKKISSSIKKIDENIFLEKKIIFFDNRIEDYFYIYENIKFNKYQSDLRPLKNLVSKNYDIKNDTINNILNNNFILISMSKDKELINNYLKEFINKYDLKNSCNIKTENLFSFKNIESRGENLYVDKIKCN